MDCFRLCRPPGHGKRYAVRDDLAALDRQMAGTRVLRPSTQTAPPSASIMKVPELAETILAALGTLPIDGPVAEAVAALIRGRYETVRNSLGRADQSGRERGL